MKLARLDLQIPDDLKRELRIACAEDGKNMTEVIERLLILYLRQRKERKRAQAQGGQHDN